MKYVFPNIRRALLALCLFLATCAPALAQPFSKDDERASPAIMKIFRKVVAKPSDSVVRVLCNGKEAALGTIIEADGLILTKASLLRGTITCKLKDGKVLPAEVLGEHDGCDLAMLKVGTNGLKPIEWRPALNIKQGMWLAAVGQSEEPIAIGVVGVLPGKLTLDEQQGPGPKAGFLGVSMENADKGAKIKAFPSKTSAAAKAGLKVGDVVIQVGTRPVTNMQSLQAAVQRHKAGQEVMVKVVRDKETLNVKVTLGSPPDGLVRPQDMMGSELSDRRGGFKSVMQTDVVVKPGDCGGPVVDLDGKTVGITISRSGRTETYAIPAEEIQALLSDLKSGKLRVVELPVGFNEVLALRATGNLTEKDQADKVRAKRFHQVHTVKLIAGAEYVVELKSGEFDAFLRVEDAKGNKIQEDDDSGGDFNAKVTFRAPADGEYRVIVTTFNEGETGEYALTVRQTAAPKNQ